MRLNSVNPTAADFIQGIEEEESDDVSFIADVCCITLFSAIETAEDIDPAIERLIFEGVIASTRKGRRNTGSSPKSILLPGDSRLYIGEWTLFNECAIITKKKGCCKPDVPTV